MTHMMAFSQDLLSDYYDNRFQEDFRQYFPSYSQEYGLMTEVYKHTKLYWEYIIKEKNASDKIFFTGTLLYMYLAQHSFFIKADYDAYIAFPHCSGWPFINVDGGSAHPLLMLECAGLFPHKNETKLFLDALKTIFPVFREEFNSVLNGSHPNMKGNPAADVFLKKINSGRVKAEIIKFMDTEERRIYDLIDKWEESKDNMCNSFLLENGVSLNIYPTS